ncbi:MAG: tetratricopeptide repeat protein [Candidatus Eisenbacteria sp.]|nr:tetratricopeptide repeat protein [Candidatus Eisenbacteria bacterium]
MDSVCGKTTACLIVGSFVLMGGWGADSRARAQSSDAQDPPSASSAEEIFRQALASESAAEAERAYELLLERFPEHSLADDALFALAMQHYSLGYQRTSEREFSRLLEQYPEGNRAEDAGYWDGVVLLALGQLDAAMDRFSWVIDRGPSSEKSTWARIGIADCFRLKGDFPQAARAYEEMLERFPSADLESTALHQLARVYERLEDPARARSLYIRLSESYPDTYQGVQATARLADWPQPLRIPPEADSLETEAGEESGGGASGNAQAEEHVRAVESQEIWILQTGAFAVEENAERLERVLSARGYPEVRIETNDSGSEPFHRVLVGRFSTRDEGETMAAVLRQRDNLETHIFRRIEPVPKD